MTSPFDKTSRPNNLPVPLSDFVGRRREIAAVGQHLRETRLLTLTGPGGSGKTRLALQVARGMLGQYSDGIWLVELAPLTENALIPQVVATTLGLREQAGIPLKDTLAIQLQKRDLLLIFDNCEHLLTACAELSAALLKSCPQLRILSTSREPLGVQGEVVWVIPPLSLPDPQPWRSPAEEEASLDVLKQAEAIQLFSKRAQAIAPQFRLDIQNGRWVADICRRLDGLPLAIELAAARVRALSTRQIAERLDDRFQLLTARQRTTHARQQSLEATLDWSFALLTEAEQDLLQRLSVFAGGWTLEAAEAVGASDTLAPHEISAVLASLVDKSLVSVNASGERRYYLLETIRQYAQRRLSDADLNVAARDRHRVYFLDWAEQNAANLIGPDQAKWLKHFDAEHDNLRAALEWRGATAAPNEWELRLATACGYFWKTRGYLSEGKAYLSRALSRPEAQEQTMTRALALLTAANLAYLQSDYTATRALAEEGLTISDEHGPEGKAAAALAYDLLGELATEVGNYEEASELFHCSLSLYRAVDDKRGVADVLMQLGWAAMREGDLKNADALQKESLGLLRKVGETRALSMALSGLGELAIREGCYEEAQILLEESLSLYGEIGERWGVAAVLGSLGWVALRQDDYGRMRELLQQSIAIRMDIGERGGVAWCLEKLAEAAAVQAQALPASSRRKVSERAAYIYGAAAALRSSLNSVIDPADVPTYEQITGELRAELGAEAYAAAWQEGAVMPLPELIDLALDPPAAAAPQPSYGGLTPRERETAILIAQGKTNHEIADEMTVREKTIETYVTRILNKLGFNSRVQVAVWALETGLVKNATNNS